jgi:hypothetical protein
MSFVCVRIWGDELNTGRAMHAVEALLTEIAISGAFPTDIRLAFRYSLCQFMTRLPTIISVLRSVVFPVGDCGHITVWPAEECCLSIRHTVNLLEGEVFVNQRKRELVVGSKLVGTLERLTDVIDLGARVVYSFDVNTLTMIREFILRGVSTRFILGWRKLTCKAFTSS